MIAPANKKRATTRPVYPRKTLSRNGGNGECVRDSEIVTATRRKSKRVAVESRYDANGDLASRSKNKRTAGERKCDGDANIASSAQNNRPADFGSATDGRLGEGVKNGQTMRVLKTNNLMSDQGGSDGDSVLGTEANCAATCRQLQELQRRRAATIKSRCAIDRQLESLVANEFGYSSGLEEKDRKARFKKAADLISAVDTGKRLTGQRKEVAERVAGIIVNTKLGRSGFEDHQKRIDKEMTRLVKTLPVAKWCESVRGFGLMSLGVIVGETGDLSLYANPAKVWKRMGLAPFQGKMPSTWRREGGLKADQWTEIGYSPRRRAIMFVIGECIVKANKGEYRKRYDEAKASAAAKHPDWTKLHCHNHGMLLAVKRLVRDLWRQWRASP